MARTLVMSIRPAYAARIFEGTKAVELRRTRPHIDGGDVVLVYASSPVKALIGAFAVGGIISEDVAGMWKRHSSKLGVSLAEYAAYFEGVDFAYGLRVAAQVSFTPVSLESLRQSVGFRPPQSYMFWHGGLADLVPRAAEAQLRAMYAAFVAIGHAGTGIAP